MNLRISTFSALLFVMVFFTACPKNEDDSFTLEQGGTLTATVDGDLFSASGTEITAEHNTINTVTHTLTIGGIELPINGVTKSIVLAAVLTNNPTGFVSGEVYTASDPDRVAAGEYVRNDNSVDIKALSSNTGEATITITEIDFTNNLVSGTFSFDASDDDDPNTIYKIRNGEFKEVAFD